MSEITLPGDQRAVDNTGYWLRPWHALLELLARRLDTAETDIETINASITSINQALAENDIAVTPPTDEEPAEEPEPEEPDEPEPTVSNWFIAMKAESQEMVSTSGYFDDPDLQFSIAPDEAFAFRLVAHWQTINNADIQWRLNGPVSPVMLCYQMTDLSDDGSRIEAIRNTFATSRSRGNDQARGTIEIDGVVQNGPTGGIVVFQWGPDSSHSDITRMLKGSYLEYRKIV